MADHVSVKLPAGEGVGTNEAILTRLRLRPTRHEARLNALGESVGLRRSLVSCYFDHTQGRLLKGHQVLQLGLAGQKGFLPVEAQLVMGEKAAIDKPQNKPFRDQRSAAARDFRRAREKTKHQLFRSMLHRAVQTGWQAPFVLADAWFGCKENIQR